MRKILFTGIYIFLISAGLANAQSSSAVDSTRVIIRTDYGEIRIVLYDETKLHRDNFIKLVSSGYYDDQIFHRLIKDFMIQGGDPNSKNSDRGEILGQGGPGYTIPAEIIPKYFHKKGALAAARMGDAANPARASSGSQFYIIQGKVFSKAQLDLMEERKLHSSFTVAETEAHTTQGGSPHLDGAYTVFGEVEQGFDVLEKLMEVPTDGNDRPLQDIKFKMEILQ